MENIRFKHARRKIRHRAVTITILFHLLLFGSLLALGTDFSGWVKNGIEQWIIGDEQAVSPEPGRPVSQILKP
ncbi:MAG: hypothetical protein ACO4CH_09885 [Saprospiraceae bacterium]|jgi:hypothetical protein